MFTFLADMDRCSGISARLAPRFGVLRLFWAHLSCRPQFISHQPHITQRKERHDLRGVFDQSFVPSLLIAELALDDTELMLNFGSDRGLKVFEFSMVLLIRLLSLLMALRLEGFMATCQAAFICLVSSRFSTPV
jgi:hypothetical protein